MSKLDPQLRSYFDELATLFPPLPLDPTPFMRRSRYWTICALGRTALPSSVTMNDVELSLPNGTSGATARTIRVRLFYGHDGRDEPVPTVIYFHGGGWVIGDIETHTVTCARMAFEANALVASVEYPLDRNPIGAKSLTPVFTRPVRLPVIAINSKPARRSPLRATVRARIWPPLPRFACVTKILFTSHCRRSFIHAPSPRSILAATTNSRWAPGSPKPTCNGIGGTSRASICMRAITGLHRRAPRRWQVCRQLILSRQVAIRCATMAARM
jgi:alpha/beta hydrolase fold